ncbi:MAG: HD domain-containing protein [Muribaculaceae bacterium]|nr:HD domain-containing protein [Muribaculaceae bacterium]
MNIQILTDRIKNDEFLNNLASFFPNDIYLVGGSVRDFLLGKKTYDRDLIVTDEDAGEFSKKVAAFFGGTFIPLDVENRIYRVVMPDKVNEFDITNPVEDSLEKDIYRRDLALNAVAVDIRTGNVFDPCGGIKDIENRVIKGVREQNFTDDPLRLLRIFRFHSSLGFEIDESLTDVVKRYSNLISKPAKERVRYELLKLFNGEFAHSALLKMDECGLLEEVFPFVKELKQVPPNAHHHLDLFHHSIETVYQVGKFYESSSDAVKNHLDSVDFGGFSRLAHLRLASFMHDIGKYSTWTIEDDGRHRFLGHDAAGAKLAVPLLKNLCFSNKQIEYLTYIIKKHMYATMVVSAPDKNEKTLMRFIRKSEDNAIDCILIAKADRLAAQGPEITKEIVDKNISDLDELLDYYLSAWETLKPLPKLLDGNEVMSILNIEPSKRLGQVLEALKEAQISGDILSKDDAINFVKQL